MFTYASEQVAIELEGLSWGQFKPMLADALIEVLSPVREEHGALKYLHPTFN